jgi:hypothetical protein
VVALKTQRLTRDGGGLGYRAQVRASVWGRRLVQALGVVLILAGLVGAVVTR